ncbi:transmembrane anchor protein [Poseidonocella sp. HB161398]|uniref:transmembrane anchor protein n=1 Tax=Poseidonocella sp. HB161398 TaxID=2320855 RepID=UPI00110A045B|nr:transmembrane anchor protein [Poseidonocella sp. HB161398]
MFNSHRPSLEELPSTAQLLRSTLIAAASAAAILVTVVLPAEYGIDPTGAGRVLGLTEMGEIKSQLAEEAEADRQIAPAAGEQSSLLDGLLGLFVGQAHAQEAPAWRDEVTFALEPGASAEWKMMMAQGDQAQYRVTVEGGRVNYDLHGHGGGETANYERGRGSAGSEGGLIAPFEGEHGWFFRNRDKVPVTVTVQVAGDYSEFFEIR